MFQDVQNAFNVLSDALKRRQYDRQLRNTNSNDGMTVVSKDRVSTKGSTEERRSAIVELPSNPSNLTVSELISLLSSLGINSDDCFEKRDYIDKINEYKRSKSGPSEVKSPKASTAYRSNTRTEPIHHELPNKLPAVKVISVGAQEVGKSCIIKRYCEGRFVKKYIPTIGVDYGVKVVDTKHGSIAVHFFDLSGNEDFKLIRQEFYYNAQGAILSFDVNDKETLKLLSSWENEIKANGLELNKLQIVVMGNKLDVGRREVTETEGKKWAKIRGYPYYDSSANTGVNISQALDYLFDSIAKNVLEMRKKYKIS